MTQLSHFQIRTVIKTKRLHGRAMVLCFKKDKSFHDNGELQNDGEV